MSIRSPFKPADHFRIKVILNFTNWLRRYWRRRGLEHHVSHSEVVIAENTGPFWRILQKERRVLITRDYAPPLIPEEPGAPVTKLHGGDVGQNTVWPNVCRPVVDSLALFDGPLQKSRQVSSCRCWTTLRPAG